MGAFSYFQDKYFGKKLKELVSSTSCGTGIIIALPQNSSLSQRSIKHSSYDKGKPIDGSSVPLLASLVDKFSTSRELLLETITCSFSITLSSFLDTCRKILVPTKDKAISSFCKKNQI